MVLQRAPKSAVLWGWGAAGAAITITIDGQAVVNGTVDATGAWRLEIPPQRPSVNRTVTVTSVGKQVTLEDVAFGDV